jgi:hypothetical protein
MLPGPPTLAPSSRVHPWFPCPASVHLISVFHHNSEPLPHWTKDEFAAWPTRAEPSPPRLGSVPSLEALDGPELVFVPQSEPRRALHACPLCKSAVQRGADSMVQAVLTRIECSTAQSSALFARGSHPPTHTFLRACPLTRRRRGSRGRELPRDVRARQRRRAGVRRGLAGGCQLVPRHARRLPGGVQPACFSNMNYPEAINVWAAMTTWPRYAR